MSNIFAELDREVKAFHRRSLKDEYRYLFLDGIYVSIKGALKASKKPVLVAYGIEKDGTRELIHFKLSRSESRSEWEAFLNSLYRRGLIGEELELIITDGHKGLEAALDVVYPYPKRQFCWAHSKNPAEKKIRTTNVIERALREVRRRTYANGCFAHTESCERTIYTVVVHMNRRWRERTLKGF